MVGLRCCTFAALALSIAAAFGPSISFAQVSGARVPPTTQQTLPITTQIKKTIVFLESDCLHDFEKDANNLSVDKVAQMPVAQQQNILHQLATVFLRLRSVKVVMNKLTADESERLFTNNPVNGALDQLPSEIEWRLRELIKITTLTDEEIASLTDADRKTLPLDRILGTGFLVGYIDPRLKPQVGNSSARYFRYLVTNRHVVQPGVEKGAPCKLLASYIILNRKPDPTHNTTYAEMDRTDKVFRWATPQDDSVDLAVTPIGFDDKLFDHMAILTSQFVTESDITDRHVVEGDPVLFAGLFIQTFSQDHTLEPIIRSGTLAMVPEGMLETTLDKRFGHIFLADAHVFGGNSGSPIFVDPNKFAGIISGPAYKLLGVISGEVFENSDLTLSVATQFSGNVAANSDVSIVVPAPELMKLLDSPTLKADRDRQIQELSPK